MTALLTDNLPLLAGAPNGIKKLRELILELAVCGKLVPQDPSNEPASELLKRIAQEKAQLVADGRIKKQKPLAAIAEEDQPFKLPAGWEWASTATLALLITDGTHHTPTYISSGVPFISVKDIDGTTISFDKCKYISQEEHIAINARCNPERGDILLCRIGTLGRPTIVDTEVPFSLFVSVGLLKLPKKTEFSRYFHCVLSSPLMYRQYDQIKAGGSHTNKLNLGDIPRLLVPVPPLAEQHRIVAKVDELMAMCDRLEAQQADEENTHTRLVQALLGSLTQTSDAADFTASWKRLARHFHTLFTTKTSIDALEQTLLQLAMMGKLVPQNPGDEPACELIKSIQSEKHRLRTEEGLRTTAREDVPKDEHYFQLNAGWVYYRLGNLARFIDYRGRTPTKTPSGIPLITAKNVRLGFISREPREFIAKADYSSWMTRGFPRIGDLLFTTEAPMGNIALIDISEQFALAQRVICFQLHELAIGPFLKLVIMSSAFQQQLLDVATGMTATGIKSSRLKEIPIPLPPLAEQHRIVAKVDQLMTLCDQLKTRLTQARQLNEQLASTLVEQAVA